MPNFPIVTDHMEAFTRVWPAHRRPYRTPPPLQCRCSHHHSVLSRLCLWAALVQGWQVQWREEWRVPHCLGSAAPQSYLPPPPNTAHIHLVQMYSPVVRPSCALSGPSDASSAHLAPCIAYYNLLTIFLCCYLHICDYSVTLNLYCLIPSPFLPCPSTHSSLTTVCFLFL